MTRKQLLAEITKRNNTDETPQEQMLWFIAYQEALAVSESFTGKDIAWLFLKGIPKMSNKGIDAWLEEYGGDDADLLKTLDNFYGMAAKDN